MIIKNALRIFKSYKFFLFQIIFFEIIYSIRGYKGNSFNFSGNQTMADNIPCPYYFLYKIKKTLKQYKFHKFIDLGCGSGRVIDYFDKNFNEKKFVGIEYFSNQYDDCIKSFNERTNINIILEDFTNFNFIMHNADCYFFNNPFKKDSNIIEMVDKISKHQSIKENILFIFVNFDKKVIEKLNNIECIQNYYINNNKGFSIYLLNKKKTDE